ncbi:hypothetical protein IV55_GL001534 [Furfurilactobacillus siliginis]|uniref:Uncharacterized protein n=2 Tax=Furfurilactobacillus siliginis TaxID=348151 RepID=A0A0R2L8P2_9LACO|nr:hypothetical protein IV55_GL001534 [Furfurilactobacillus siliginis]
MYMQTGKSSKQTVKQGIVKASLAIALMTVGAGFVQAQTQSAQAASHTVLATKKAAKTSDFWADHTYQGSYNTQSTLGKKETLKNQLQVTFTKDGHYTQQVITRLSMSGIQEQVTTGKVTKADKTLTLQPESTVTAVYKNKDDQSKHQPANYHQSGQDFGKKLTFDGKGQPEAYTIQNKDKKLIAGKPTKGFMLKASKVTLVQPKAYVDQLQK